MLSLIICIGIITLVNTIAIPFIVKNTFEIDNLKTYINDRNKLEKETKHITFEKQKSHNKPARNDTIDTIHEDYVTENPENTRHPCSPRSPKSSQTNYPSSLKVSRFNFT